MAEVFLIGQIAGLRVAEATLEALVLKMKCTEAESKWLLHSISMSIEGIIQGMLTAAKNAGMELPKDVVPKDLLPYEVTLQTVKSALSGYTENADFMSKMYKQAAVLGATAFGNSDTLKRQYELYDEMFSVAKDIDPKEIADQLHSRHLKLVH